jgi:hypothetical protein
LPVVVVLAVAAAPELAGAVAVADAGAAAVEAAAENKLLGAAVVVVVAAGVADDVDAGAPNNGAAALELVVAVDAAGWDGVDEAALPKRLLADGAADAAGAWALPNKPPAGEELAGGLKGFDAPKRELPELAVAGCVGAVVCADDDAGVVVFAPNSPPPPRPVLGAAPRLGASALVVAGFAGNILDPNVLPKLDGAALGAVEAVVAAGGWNILLGGALF